MNQDKLLKACLKLQIKMNKLLHKSMFNFRYSIEHKASTKYFASTNSIIKNKRQDKNIRKERINLSIDCFNKSKQELIKAKKQSVKYCILARSLDYIFNDLIDNKTSQKFYDIIDFKEHL